MGVPGRLAVGPVPGVLGHSAFGSAWWWADWRPFRGRLAQECNTYIMYLVPLGKGSWGLFRGRLAPVCSIQCIGCHLEKVGRFYFELTLAQECSTMLLRSRYVCKEVSPGSSRVPYVIKPPNVSKSLQNFGVGG